jgi:putative OPT family oligopeptide transporter
MQVLGVLSSAIVMAPILSLLNTAYGFGAPTPEKPNALAAPQASLAESVARGVFGGELPWGMIYTGMLIGAVIIALDKWLESRGSEFRMPVLAVAVGIYLPFELDSAIMLGGLLAWMTGRTRMKLKLGESKSGLLFASGLITGEALMGIVLAIPIAIYSGVNIFQITDQPLDGGIGFIVLAGICYWLYKVSTKK